MNKALKKLNNIAKEYNYYIVTFIVIMTFNLFEILHYHIEHNTFNHNNEKNFRCPVMITAIFIIYIITDINLKKLNMKKILRIPLDIIATSTISSSLLLFLVYNFGHPAHVHININQTGLFQILHLIFEFSLEMSIYLLTVFLTQNIIKKFILGPGFVETAGFRTKIPLALRDQIYLIKSKENYVDVYYGDGNQHKLIHYRFHDAVDEMHKDFGIQIHRSFWISNNSLKTLKRIDGKYFVTAKNGEKIPVSRTYINKVKESKNSN